MYIDLLINTFKLIPWENVLVELTSKSSTIRFHPLIYQQMDCDSFRERGTRPLVAKWIWSRCKVSKEWHLLIWFLNLSQVHVENGSEVEPELHNQTEVVVFSFAGILVLSRLHRADFEAVRRRTLILRIPMQQYLTWTFQTAISRLRVG